MLGERDSREHRQIIEYDSQIAQLGEKQQHSCYLNFHIFTVQSLKKKLTLLFGLHILSANMKGAVW